MTLGQIAIEDIQLDARCSDDIPAVLKGIQHIYCDPSLRESVFALLQESVFAAGESASETQEGAEPTGINPDVGRSGMDLWHVLVLGLLKQGIDCDYDRLHDLANQHASVRRMLGIGDVFGGVTFSYRTLARNVALLTPELLADVNRLVVEAGHELAGCRPGEPLQARCDSFTVETDVHYPTDVSLLWDALRRKNRRTTPEGLPLHSFSTLLQALGTRCRHQCPLRGDPDGPTVERLTEPTPLQERALELVRPFPVDDNSNS